MSSEVIRVPSVVLSERAFERAQNEGILDIVPNRDHMLAIGQITETGDEYLPDITVLRDYGRVGKWDVNFKDASPELPYFPATELGTSERGLQIVSAGGLRHHTYDTNKTLLELTVRDWDLLGGALAEAIETKKTLEKGHPGQGPDLIANAVGWAISSLFNKPNLQSRSQKIASQATALRPYAIVRGQ